MKKFLSIILALTFCLAAFSAFSPSISAKSGTISESEAKELVIKAYNFSRDVRYNSPRYVTYSDDKRIELEFNSGRYSYYWIVNEESLPGGSYEKMCEYAQTIYTKDTADMSYAYPFTATVQTYETMWENLRPLFYRDEKSVLFASPGDVPSYTGACLYPNIENVEIEIVSGDSQTAKANITVYFAYIDGPRTDDFDIVECRFEKTAHGWRIAESEYSLVLATEHAYLKDYRAKNPDAPNPSGGGLLVADAREVLRFAIGQPKFIYEYISMIKGAQTDYAQNDKYASIFKEISLPDGSVRKMEYIPKGMRVNGYGYDFSVYEYGDFCTDQVMEKLNSKAYTDNNFDMYIKENGIEYLAYFNADEDLSQVCDPETAVIEIIESTDKTATARIYCGLKDGENVIPISVECKFEKGSRCWFLADSPFVDMLASTGGFEYTVGEAPSTGDNAFDTIALCLGGMAIVISSVCFVRRRRIEE